MMIGVFNIVREAVAYITSINIGNRMFLIVNNILHVG